MKKRSNLIKGLVLSVISLAAGFFAISLPFNLISTLSKSAMEVIFLAEIIIYFGIGMIFLVIKDKKNQQRIKDEIRHTKRKEKIEAVKRDWIDIAA